MEQDGVGISTEAAQGRVAQGGLSRNGRIYRIAYRKCLKRKYRRKLPLLGLRCLTFAVKDFAYAVKETRRQVRFLHDKINYERRESMLRLPCEHPARDPLRGLQTSTAS